MSELPEDLQRFLCDSVGQQWSADPLRGDASVRAYYRVSAEPDRRWMAAYYPEDVRPSLRRFLDAYDAVAPSATVPEIIAHSESSVLQQDVGDRTLFDLLDRDRERALVFYRRAIELLIRFQRSPERAGQINPAFTADQFFAEMELTSEYWVRRMCEVDDPAVHRELARWLRILADKIAQHPYVLCHRDYHGQNLHLLNDTLYIIDYQDLRRGPDTYDLASLLRDRGVARIIGRDTEEELIAFYARETGSDQALRQRYFETLLQRSIKILNTFARQSLERGRHHYLDFIPPTLESIERCFEELPEFTGLKTLFPMRVAGTRGLRAKRRGP